MSLSLQRLQLRLYKAFNIFFKVKRFRPSTFEPLRTSLIAEHFSIGLIIDVGANKGQFSEELLILGYGGRIVSFEPSLKAHEELVKRAKKYARWDVYDPIAIGAEKTQLEFYEYSRGVFNSLLKLKGEGKSNNERLEKVNKRIVEVKRLDDIIPNLVSSNEGNLMIKIDTQGYEKQVIEGCSENLKSASIIKIEVPIKAMYEKVEWTFYDTIDFMKEHNFHPINFDLEGVNASGVVRTIDMSFLNLNKHEFEIY